MGLFDKLKNVFFEEEYIEVEEPVKKEKVTVAKKIETPEAKKAKEEAIKREKEVELEEVEVKEIVKEIEKVEEQREIREKEREREKRFPMDFDESDFTVEEKVVSVVEKREEVPVRHEREVPVYQEKTVYRESTYHEKPLYKEKVEYDEVRPSKNDYHTSVNYQGLYEGSEKKEKKVNFTPSPIISPIYGILDKNYKKEEIVTKKEVRLSVTSSKKVDLDYVREKAYGDLASEITESIHEEVISVKEEEVIPEPQTSQPVVEENDLLYDLNEDESPAVKVVTMGDAEEYFNDLGLEYNVDYKVEKEKMDEVEKPVPRRADRRKNSIDNVEDEIVRTYERDLTDDDSNLFDLIDSMYDDKE